MTNRFLNPLGQLLEDFYTHADWREHEAAFARRYRLPMAAINSYTGGYFILPCEFDGNGFFKFSKQGEAACVFEVYDAETVIDLCAFALAKPETFGTALGNAVVLGQCHIANPGTWALGKTLPIYRTPLEWLQAGCDGVCVLDHVFAPAMLGDALGPLLAADEAHQRSLRNLLCTPPVDPRNILVRAEAGRAA